ncbi:MAG: roadblock/LC7 domain-containing protein [Myxococcota bacterium]
MANYDLSPLSEIDGYVAAALVDADSGMLMNQHGDAPFPLELASAGNTEVLKAKRKTMSSLKLQEPIEDMLITLDSQYHVIRPTGKNANVFLYVVLSRAKSNLAMARHIIREFESVTSL